MMWRGERDTCGGCEVQQGSELLLLGGSCDLAVTYNKQKRKIKDDESASPLVCHEMIEQTNTKLKTKKEN